MAHVQQTLSLTESDAGVIRRPYDRPADVYTQDSIIPRGQMIYTARDEAVPATGVGNTQTFRVSCKLDDNYAYAVRSLNIGLLSNTSSNFYDDTALVEVTNYSPERDVSVLGRCQIDMPSSGTSFPYNSSLLAQKNYSLNKPMPGMLLGAKGSPPYVYADLSTGSNTNVGAYVINVCLFLDVYDIEQYYSGYAKQVVPTQLQL